MQQIDIILTPEGNPEQFGSVSSFISKMPKNQWGKPCLPNKALPQSLVPHLSAVYKAIFNQPLPTDDYTVSFRVDENGGYQRTMTPFVGLDEEMKSLVLYWGKEKVELTYTEGGKVKELKSSSTNPEDLDSYEFSFDNTSFGIGEDPCLKLSLDEGDTLITMAFALYRNKEAIEAWKNFKVDAANRLLKKGGTFEGFISSIGSGGEAGRLYNLEVGKEYKVVQATVTERDGGNGKYSSVFLQFEDGSAVFGNKYIANILAADPEPIIDKEHPATLIIHGTKGNRVNCVFLPSAHQRATASGIDYSLLEDCALML